MVERDGAWINDATIAAGRDTDKNTVPLKVEPDGTLDVNIGSIASPIDVIVDNIVPVSQSGTWTVNLASEPIIDIGKVDQGTPNTAANAWPVKITDGTDTANVTGAGALQVDGSAVTQPVSGTIAVSNFPATQPVSGTVAVSNFPATQPVSGTVTANAGTGTLLVDGSAHTQPVSQVTSPWVVSGAVTTSPDVNVHDGSGTSINSTSNSLNVAVTNNPSVQATQHTFPWQVNFAAPPLVLIEDSLGNVLNSTANALDVFITNTEIQVAQGPANTPSNAWPIQIVDSAGSNIAAVDAAGDLQVDVNNFPASTAVTQSTSPWVVGQATGTNLHTVVDSGHIIIDSGSTTVVTGNVTAVQPTGTNLHTVLDSGTLTSITNALPAGSNVIGHVITDSGSTTAVTGNVTVVQATGTNLHAVIDSGTVSATQGTSPWIVKSSNAATSTVARKASSATNQTLAASNANRRALILYNDGTANQFVKFGATATTSDFTVKLVANAYYEVPQPCYSGIVDCISSNTNGGIQVTEIS